MIRTGPVKSFFVVAVFLFILECLLRYLPTNPELLPYPSIIIENITSNYTEYLAATLSTLTTVVSGLIPAIIVGWGLAFLTHEISVLSICFLPFINISQLVPKTVLIPIFLAIPWLGYSFNSKVLITFLISFFPVFVDTLLGLKQLNKNSNLLKYFKSLSASKTKTIKLLKIPYVMPFTFNGIKTAALYSVIGAVTSEILMGSSGLGYMIDYSATKLNFARAFGGIIFCVLLGSVIMFLLYLVQRKARILNYEQN
jgi:NitT/TauT family transport system permease protein